MALKFFHLPRSKQFHITPRFWDPDAEERDDREKRIKEEMGIFEVRDPNKPFTSNIKGQFRQAMGRVAKTDENARRNSNIRLAFFIVILSFLAYLLFFR